ncbi:uncharacterized protein KNAG_0C06160 [Huiozyma naganishii CBS 8797]|uniref:DUF2470 domain-containing protein n=1 Tax=Huiozyma naganishii (strain ATCC MYA-139 / BCRC 22969 / CBS 8797 / KCTC 17520 / NBRC 10181 / NCYC 3082 / Yp74L-3) TaxID=1071383 RepID=J7RXB2_HUIN7|nr:hypothetical protein KNAG_0C06160 [Kazachstania naganishii CBS 8797]CCK69712.1 hypothetical protein KNAG_0C06160 [Kazachstania naganishii CBS 8797]
MTGGKEDSMVGATALQDILFVYGGVQRHITSVELRTVDRDNLTIDYSCSHGSMMEKSVTIPEKFRSANSTDAVRAMAHEACQVRGLSPYEIREVIPPNTVLDWLIVGGVFLPTLCYVYRPALYCLGKLPLFPAAVLALLDNDRVLLAIIVLEFVAHAAETLFIVVPKLQYYRTRSQDRTAWLLLGLLEGYGPARRLDDRARAIAAAKNPSPHSE